ncbi:MAG: PDZ domain-containing protein [Prevotellaceae bacterium]|jgi:carboxyl-terminal processing protease|nr:PDZ domain-containing protein [Prevotellaceae bacterium]
MKKIIYLAFASLLSLTAAAQPHHEVTESYQKFAQLLLYINSHYVDSAGIGKLTEKAIIATLQNLDPHSTYLNADEFKTSNEPLEGNFEGVGIEFNILNDTLTVVSPISGGPSQAVGIRAADRIVTVDNENIAGVGLTNAQVLKYLRGPKGTKVSLTIARKGVPQPLSFTVVRDKIPIHSVDAAYEVQPGMAYIRLGRFSLTTLDEMKEAMKKFKKTPASMILDLRNNSGGVFKTSVDLCNQFFDAGHLLVYTEGLHYPKTMELSGNDGFFKAGKLVVLLDEGSASASEIVAGCIQDWDRGILIGRRSYGKGLVQQLLPLTDGSQIRLTVARYHTPTGRLIQRPYNAGETEKYYADLYKRALHGEFFSRDSIRFPDTLKYYTLSKQRVVYGGGGIMPDIFMPRDTTGYSKYYDHLVRAGLLHQFTMEYADTHRSRLEKNYKTIAGFDKQFYITDDIFEQFLAYAEKQGVARDAKGLEISGNDMRLQLKALLARTLWDTGAYYEIINKRLDKEFIKAVEVLNNWSYYAPEILF